MLQFGCISERLSSATHKRTHSPRRNLARQRPEITQGHLPKGTAMKTQRVTVRGLGFRVQLSVYVFLWFEGAFFHCLPQRPDYQTDLIPKGPVPPLLRILYQVERLGSESHDPNTTAVNLFVERNSAQHATSVGLVVRAC